MANPLKFVLFIFLSLILCNCQDKNETEPIIPTPNDDYYVKYEADITSVYIGNSIKYTVTTENGKQTFVSGKTFTQTFGPVKEGFVASITADASGWEQAYCYVKIYVSRNNEPFALKANNSSSKMSSASYTIDY